MAGNNWRMEMAEKVEDLAKNIFYNGNKNYVGYQGLSNSWELVPCFVRCIYRNKAFTRIAKQLSQYMDEFDTLDGIKIYNRLNNERCTSDDGVVDDLLG